MPADLNHITQLLYRTIRGQALPAEDEATLSAWAAESPYNREVLATITDEHTFDHELRERLNKNYEADWQKLQARIGIPVQPPVHRVHFLKTTFFKYAAAILILAGIGTYLWNTQNKKEKPAVATTENPHPVQNDVAPGGNKATLTLADGKKIVLDDAANGQVAKERGATIIKEQNGQIIYRKETGAAATTVALNTMSTPRGGQYQLVLPDGSRVWLNAESSITYPVTFTGNQRSVSVTGEAYFEVAKDKSRPFRVTAGSETIEVLGTHFNVNAYANEEGIKTSLLEGSVSIGSKILTPGQAYIDGKVVATNTKQDVAWKNGAFSFSDATLPQVMRQLSRWYDVEIVYPAVIPQKRINGDMGRDLNLSQILHILRDLGINCTLENKKIIIHP